MDMTADPKDADGWPLVALNDDGIRPAGRSDECFYCRQRVGQPHQRDCVIVRKKVRVLHVFTVDVMVPHSDEPSTTEFHYNESSSCADNILRELERERQKRGCLCSIQETYFLSVVDETPVRELRKDPSDGVEG
jgi:hypothetical protein